ncbi:MAG TPA: hypothetical protein PLV68_12505, partial [Ilumatobacteraceae bacterium]|nr:hypothetical protein [Ilumatobacteraceae bacterium]
RRVALGNLVLPVEPAPGFGGLLLGAVVAHHLGDVDDDFHADISRLLDQIDRGERIVQPRLRYRFQVDRHGLATSRHRMEGEGDNVHFSFTTNASALAQVLGAIYAIERLDVAARHALVPVIHKAMRWRGPIGPSFIAHLAGTTSSTLRAMADPRAWALEVFGFPVGTTTLSKKQIVAAYRDRLREVHPDHGGDHGTAHRSIANLGEARRILLT